jgi:hypothetical protein
VQWRKLQLGSGVVNFNPCAVVTRQQRKDSDVKRTTRQTPDYKRRLGCRARPAGPGTDYLVIRRLKILLYTEYFGPLYSTAKEAQADAERLFGKDGYLIEVRPWGQVSDELRAQCQNKE